MLLKLMIQKLSRVYEFIACKGGKTYWHRSIQVLAKLEIQHM